MSNLTIPIKNSTSKLFASEINQIVEAINSKQDLLNLTNNLTTNSTGTVLDATQGKVLKDLIDQIASFLNTKEPTIILGNSLQYFRGDKTWAALNQDVVPSGVTNKAYTAVEQAKLASLINYTLPVATSSVLGGVKQGTNISIATDGTISSTGGTATTDASLLVSGTISINRLPTLGVSNITNLQSALDSKSNVGHSQGANTITGLATVATSGMYSDLLGKPVLFSGVYSDLTGKPTIPTVPTVVSAFTNDSGYQTAANVTTAIAGKQNTLVSGTSIKTINGTTLLGSGDIVITAGGGSGDVTTTGTQTLTNKTLTAPIINNPTGITKSDVGLANVDNTTDANKPISTATATALGAKQETLVSGTNIKTINGTSLLGSGDLTIAGGSGVSQPGLVVVTTLTASGLQAAINSAVAGTIITWAGTINLTADIDIQNKTGLTLEGYGQAKLTRSDSANMIAIRGGIVDLKIAGIDFVNTATTSNLAMIFSNQQGTITGLTIERCSFTNNSTAATNALSLNCVGGGSSEFVVQYRNINVRHCRFINIGRMAVEILNHVWDGTATQLVTENVNVTDNYFENIGTGDQYGMAVSVSGLHRYVKVSRNIVYNAKYTSLEIIGGDQVIVSDNFIKDGANTSTAIVVSDGYKNGTSGFVKNMEVVNNFSDTKGRGFTLYYANNVTYSNNISISPLNIDIKSNECKILNNDITVTASNNAVVFDQASRNVVSGNTISMYPVTIAASATAALINLKAGSNNNLVLTNTLIRKTGAVYVHIETNGSTTGNITGATANSATNTLNMYIDKA